MWKSKLFLIVLIATMPLLMSQSESTDYVVLSWNDLGMHCANKDFSTLVILPPYNNLMAQVIQKGTASTMPKIMTSGYRVSYEVPGNTKSSNKTNFWQYAKTLFGLTLADNIGMKGKGLSGDMDEMASHFIAEGIPLTPYTDNDLVNEDPYQLGLVKAFDSQGKLIATSTPVVPVSGEISCVGSGCHSSEQSILNGHEQEAGFNPNNKPVLCAKCHSSNALGTPGISGAGSLSYRIHNTHANKTSDCYKCHPGAKTKCFRDVMSTSGMTCTNCHGTMKNIATTIQQGRRPWLDEPSCGASACHGSNFSENPNTLFRQSKGHGGIFCSGCHGSPHAIVPTRAGSRDNAQNVALQGYQGVLRECKVCHSVVPNAPGPHNMLVSVIDVTNDKKSKYPFTLNNTYPNPVKSVSKIPFSISKAGNVHLNIYNSNGEMVLNLINQYLLPAEYSVDLESKHLANGMYMCVLEVNGTTQSTKIAIQK